MPGADLAHRVARLPRQPGVYLWKNAAGQVLYVGKAVDLRARVASYLDPATAKHERLLEDAADVDYIAVGTERDALVLEQTLIKRHKPRYNVRLTDDKQYPYLKLTREDYPRLLKVHRKDEDGATYFGPFPDGTGAFHCAQAILDLVPLRRCRVLPDQKCLYLDLGKCAGPCVDACTPEEYAGLVADVKALLRGTSQGVLARVEARLEEAAAALRFEEAAHLRNQLHGLRTVLERQHMVAQQDEDRDVVHLAQDGDLGVVAVLHQIGGKISGQSLFVVTGAQVPGALADFLRSYYEDRSVPRFVAAALTQETASDLQQDLRLMSGHAVDVETPQRGTKMRWLDVAKTNALLRLEEERERRKAVGDEAALLAAHLGLARPVRVIEGYDISHHAGHHMRAALVRFVEGRPDKSGYRTFGIKEVGADAVARGAAMSKGAGRDVDDFAALHEAVSRRLRGLAIEDLPDLILLDGGRGQLAAGLEAVRASGFDVPIASLAKENEEVHLPKRLQPLRLDRRDPALRLLQRVRDEAHRFGITQVRAKATRGVTASPLDDVAGIGPKRRAQLVQAFGGLEGLRSASLDDLQRVPGVTARMADAIQARLRTDDAS